MLGEAVEGNQRNATTSSWQSIGVLAASRLGANACDIIEVRKKKQTLEDFFVKTVKVTGGVE